MELDINKYLDLDDMSALFDDFDIITKDEFIREVMAYEGLLGNHQVVQ